jgi:hypothetical protein
VGKPGHPGGRVLQRCCCCCCCWARATPLCYSSGAVRPRQQDAGGCAAGSTGSSALGFEAASCRGANGNGAAATGCHTRACRSREQQPRREHSARRPTTANSSSGTLLLPMATATTAASTANAARTLHAAAMLEVEGHCCIQNRGVPLRPTSQLCIGG